MAKNDSLPSIGKLLVQIALALFLIISGINAIQNDSSGIVKSIFSSGNDTASAIKCIFKGDAAKVMIIVFSIVEILCGSFLALRLVIGKQLLKFDSVISIIVIAVWILTIVLLDFLGDKGFTKMIENHFLQWLYVFCNHLIILGSLLYLNE